MKSTETINNSILESLSAAELKSVENRLEKMDLPLGKVLYYPAEKIEHIYFPVTCVISIVMVLENGDTVESGIIGREGFSGAAVILTEEVSPQEATIQLTGEAYRMPMADFQIFFDENRKFREAALRFIYAFIAQISQNAACLCHHNIDRRLARWFLMFSDRANRKELDLTQEFIAQMLGVHRPTVSKNANDLQKKGLISYNRGTIRILERAKLEDFACECYRSINESLKGFREIKTFERSPQN